MLNRISAYLQAIDDLNTGANLSRHGSRLSLQGLGRLVHLNRSSNRDSMVTTRSRRNAATNNPRFSRLAAFNREVVTSTDTPTDAEIHRPHTVKHGVIKSIEQRHADSESECDSEKISVGAISAFSSQTSELNDYSDEDLERQSGNQSETNNHRAEAKDTDKGVGISLTRIDSSVVRSIRAAPNLGRVRTSSSLRPEYTGDHNTVSKFPKDERFEAESEPEVPANMMEKNSSGIRSLSSTDTGNSVVSLRISEILKRESENDLLNRDLASRRPSITIPKSGRKRARQGKRNSVSSTSSIASSASSTSSTTSSFSASLAPIQGRHRRHTLSSSVSKRNSSLEQVLNNTFSKSETDIAKVAELYRLRSSMKFQFRSTTCREHSQFDSLREATYGGVVFAKTLPQVPKGLSAREILERKMVSGRAEWDAIGDDFEFGSESSCDDDESLVNETDDMIEEDTYSISSTDSTVSGGAAQRWNDWWDWYDETCDLFRDGEFDSWGENVEVPSHLCELTCRSDGNEWHPTEPEYRAAQKFFADLYAANEAEVVAAAAAAKVVSPIVGDGLAAAEVTEVDSSSVARVIDSTDPAAAAGPVRRKVRFAQAEIVMGFSAPYAYGAEIVSDSDEYDEVDADDMNEESWSDDSSNDESNGSNEDSDDDEVTEVAGRRSIHRGSVNFGGDDWNHGPML